MNCIKTDRRLVPKPNNKRHHPSLWVGIDAVIIATWMYSSSYTRKPSFPQRIKGSNFTQAN